MHPVMTVKTVAMLTAGGLAPCLSSAVGGLIERYTQVAPEVRIIGYRDGYAGLLTGDSIEVTDEVRRDAARLHRFGGSPLGNSRVKLTNAADCVKRGLVQEGQDPLQVAAEQLKADGVDVLHTIGGDDTNTTAADLAAYLHENDYELTVVGLPKTIDNDVVPIRQSLGAWTAADEGAGFAFNVIGEHRSNPRMLIVHECMGRNCGYLTAETARRYHDLLQTKQWAPSLGLTKERWDVHAVFLPEVKLDIAAEAERLKAIMDEQGNVNIFLSEGAGMHEIVEQLDALRAGQVGAQHAAFAAGVALRAEEGEWIALQAALQLVQLQLPAFAFGHRFAHRFLPFRRCSVSSARPARGTSSQSGR